MLIFFGVGFLAAAVKIFSDGFTKIQNHESAYIPFNQSSSGSVGFLSVSSTQSGILERPAEVLIVAALAFFLAGLVCLAAGIQ